MNSNTPIELAAPLLLAIDRERMKQSAMRIHGNFGAMREALLKIGPQLLAQHPAEYACFHRHIFDGLDDSRQMVSDFTKL